MDAKISSDFDVIVIGAGMAGLTAAASLSLAELKVLVLEARDRTGGRIHTFKSSENMGVVDLGASFVSLLLFPTRSSRRTRLVD